MNRKEPDAAISADRPPMCSSITSWVGVVPTPRELPSLVLKLSASLALNLPSRLTNSVLAFAPGREIMS